MYWLRPLDLLMKSFSRISQKNFDVTAPQKKRRLAAEMKAYMKNPATQIVLDLGFNSELVEATIEELITKGMNTKSFT